uniref:Secreted protein n=1 Tax=Romanomermis culicivorax TaxID=13658 RepID=A0A915IQT6_ROMCU
MSVTISFAVGILLPLCNNVIHGANNNFESGVPVGSFLNLPIRIFTNPRKPTELFYQTIIPSPYYPNSIFRGSAVPPVTSMEQ